jgi:hypothetical protein
MRSKLVPGHADLDLVSIWSNFGKPITCTSRRPLSVF